MKYFLPLFFIFFSTGAGAVMCRGLFGDTEIEKSIRALADLRFQLDLAIADNNPALSLTLLNRDYVKKEKDLLNYILETKYMSQKDFFELINLEIQKIQQEFSKRTKDIQKEQTIQNKLIVDRSIGDFYPFTSKYSSIEPFEVMATPTTQIMWREIGELINTKLDNQFHIENLSPSEFDSGLFPVTNVSYLDVKKWLDGLNELVRREEPKLNVLIVGHTRNYFYRLPLEREIRTFMDAAVATDIQPENYLKWTSHIDEDVTAKNTYVVQNHEYFGLAGTAERTYLLEDKKRFYSVLRIGRIHGLPEFRITLNAPSFPEFDRASAMGFRLIRQVRKP